MAPITFPKAGKAQEASTKSVEQLKADVLDRIDQIHATEQEQSAYLSSDDFAELEKMETLLQGSLALLEQFEKTGGMLPATTGIDTPDGPQLSSANMKTGWNGGFEVDTESTDYDHVIKPFNQGTDTKNGLVFKMDDTMESVTGKNVGDDIVLTITYKNGNVEEDLVEGWVTNPTSFIIAGDQTTKGVTVDLSQVMRVKGSITILGGSGNDTLIGSQGDDQIFGNAGDDIISGLGGINAMYGGAGTDEFYSVNKSDTIDGGEGYDTINVVDKDVAKAAKFTEETIETETSPVDDGNFSSPGNGWKAEADTDKGELVITKSSDAKDGGAINLTVPDGVMVYSKADGDDLILTYQTLTEGGLPGDTQVLRIKDVLNSKSSAKITITSESQDGSPSVIDLGGVNTYFNQVTLKKGDGDDVIIAPKTAFAGYGITAKDIGKASFDTVTTEKINTEMEKDKSTHWVEFDNGDSTKPFPGWKTKPKVEKGEITLYPPNGQESMDLKEPKLEGYSLESSVAETKADEITLTLFMKKDGSDTLERLVIHIKKSGDGNPKTVTVGGYAPQNKDVLTKLIANEGDTGSGIFVADEGSIDSSKAGDNEIIDK